MHNWFGGDQEAKRGRDGWMGGATWDRGNVACRVEGTTTVPRRQRGIYLRSIIGIA